MLAGHYDPSLDEREIARHFTLTRDDLELIASRRGDATRLGYAMLMLYLRWPGRVLEAGEAPPMPILAFVAHQLDVSPASRDYARRDETRRTHLADLSRRFGHLVFSRTDFHALVAFAMPIAQTVIQPSRLAGIVIDEMRRRRLLLPPVTVGGDRATGAAAGGDLVHDVLAGDLGEPERAKLDALLSRRDDKARPGSHGCATAPVAGTAYPATDRTARPCSRAGPGGLARRDHPADGVDRIADEAARITSQHLAELPDRRHAILSLPASGLRKA
jgi:hypothetical protein